ncbi:hypothetical protein TNCV_3888561 [Trichonephila clavipes]|nr:hypothetical protein TNCV_3888561 [Trichonephila clavipes]
MYRSNSVSEVDFYVGPRPEDDPFAGSSWIEEYIDEARTVAVRRGIAEKETSNSTTLSKKIAQGNLTASCKRLISWFLLYKVTELGRKIVPVRPFKF